VAGADAIGTPSPVQRAGPVMEVEEGAVAVATANRPIQSALRGQLQGERAIMKVLDWADEEFLDEVLANIRAGIDPDIAANFAELPAGFEGRLEAVFDNLWINGWEWGGKCITRALRAAGGALWRRTAFSAESDATGLLIRREAEITFAPPTEAVERYVAGRIPPLRGVHSQNLKRAVRDSVAAGRLEGEGLREITKRIAREFPQASAFRRTNIARTESSQLWNDAAMARYRFTGAVQGWEFMAVMDERTTDICAWHNGQKYRLGEGEQPPLHFMCRSTTIPILWHEDVDWTTAAPPAENRPLPGFGAPSALDIPNVTTADHFATVRAGLDVAKAARVIALIEAAEQAAIERGAT